MSTGKHTDKICIAVIALTLVITVLFMCGESLGLAVVSKAVKYESTLFDTSYVHSIDIVMDDWDSFIETCENEEYGKCTAVIDGKKQANIAIRAKGNTSLSSVKSSGSQRYSFKLEFDHYEKGKTYDGLDKLCLNNLIQDNTMMKDYIAYVLMNDFGADSPLCSFAYITVNGEDWGLYLAVEGIEDSFLSRNYGSETGELYKPDSLGFGGGRGNGKDFNPDDFDFSGEDSEQSQSDTKQETKSGSENSSRSSQGFSFGGGMPEGMTPPDGMSPPDGRFPGFSGDSSQFPDFSGDGFDPSEFSFDGSFPSFSGADGESSFSPDSADSEKSSESGKSGRPGGFGGGMGMGSDDVKLKYIDDDPDSYSNIFDNAKTEVSKTDKNRLIESLKKLSSYTDLEDVVDMDEVMRYFVVHNFVCNGDSYTGMMIHNYYLHESDGKLSMIPWDYNLAFGTFRGGNASETVNTSIDSPISMGNTDDRPMLGWIFSDESYTEKYHELFSEFIEKWFSDGELEKLITDTADMIRPYVEKDPTKFCTSDDFEKGVEALTQFVSLRGEAVSRQLSGDDTAVETGSLNLSDMGTMGGGMGGKRSSGESGSDESGTAFPGMPEGGNFSFSGKRGTGEAGQSKASVDDSESGESSGRPERPESDGNSSGERPSFPGAESGASTGDDGESGESSERPEKPESDEKSSDESRSFPGADSGMSPPGNFAGTGENGVSEKTFYILIAVSAAVLALGIIIAIKKKY